MGQTMGISSRKQVAGEMRDGSGSHEDIIVVWQESCVTKVDLNKAFSLVKMINNMSFRQPDKNLW